MDLLVAQIREIFKKDEINTEEVREILENYSSNRADWKKYAHFDPHRYTRNLVDAGNGKYNLMILCWAPGLGSNIHDHQNSHCFVKVLDGTLRETRFAWPTEDQKECPMQETSCLDSQTNSACTAWRIRLSSRTRSAFICTSRPYSECQTFDQRTGTRSKGIVTFYTKYGRKVDYRGSKKGTLVPSSSKGMPAIAEKPHQFPSTTCEPSTTITRSG
ncbi:Cysteine dioxygenase [Aphelenchoides fujianensis]|nr:Cysteine dioxygenase [Aphelenchoides fujianensis]